MFVAGNVEHKFKKGELIRRRSGSPSNAPPAPNFRKYNSRSRSRGDSSDDDRRSMKRGMDFRPKFTKRNYDDDRRSRSPNGPDLREYLATRKPRHYRSSRSPPPRPRTPSEDEKKETLERKLTHLKDLQLEYEKNPESHPQYQDEWCSYWNRRCEELQQVGIDIDNYDFKPEWLTFWKRRLKELHDEECIPIFKALRELEERKKLLAHNRNDDSWSTSEDEDAAPKGKPKPAPLPVPPPAKRPRTPSPDIMRTKRARSPPPPLSPVPRPSSRRSQRSRSPTLSGSFHAELGSSDESLTIDSALQTITNLEDSLARIGPKVIDLVGKSMNLIEGMDFDSFDRSKDMPSAKDRLNGQMLTNKIQSVLKTFENITNILKRMTEGPGKNAKTPGHNDNHSGGKGLNDDVKQWMNIFNDVIDNLDDSARYHQPSSSSQPSTAEHLTDPEVEALLQNFDSLSEKEKNHLIMFLKSLEKTDEERVKRFRYLFNGELSEALDSPKTNNNSRENSWSRREETPKLRESNSPSRSRSRERSESQSRKRPRTPSPIPAIFDNLPMLYQEQYKDPFLSDVIESLRQPHWRAPTKVSKFMSQWPDCKLHPESGALQCTVNDRDVFVIPDRIRVEIIEEFHRRQGRSGKMECRSRQETINYVRRYCFIQGDVKLINFVINRCPHCQDLKDLKLPDKSTNIDGNIDEQPKLSKSQRNRYRRNRCKQLFRRQLRESIQKSQNENKEIQGND